LAGAAALHAKKQVPQRAFGVLRNDKVLRLSFGLEARRAILAQDDKKKFT
jgi:hypothetical protein